MKLLYALIITSLLSLGSVANAQDIIGGYDFDTIPWESVCRSIKPMPLVTPTMNCNVSHPFDAFHNYDSIMLIDKMKPGTITCETIRDNYEKLQKKFASGEPHDIKICRQLAEANAGMRERNPTKYYYGMDAFLKHLF